MFAGGQDEVREPMSIMRKKIAEHMVMSKHTSAHVYSIFEVDMSEVVKRADQMNLLGLAKTAAELADRARTKRLVPDDVQGGTFTITNVGVFGGVVGLPIINQPQAAIMGICTIVKRPVVINDAIAIRPIVYVSLSYDHRIIDGADAARFLTVVKRELEKPAGD